MALDDTDQQKPDDTAKSVASSLPLPFGGSPLSPASPVAPPAATAPRSPVAPAPPLTPVQPTPAAPQQPRAAAPKPQAPANAAGLIAHFEGFRETPYWDVNHWRVGYGSDTITHPDGTVESVGPNTRVTQADAQRDLQRRTGIYQNTLLTSIGSDAYARIGAPAQNAIASVAYNYGHVPNSVVAAAQTGDPQKVAAAIAALPANPQRRAQEAGSILGTFSAGALAGTGGGAMQLPAGAATAQPAPGADLAGFSSLEQPKAEEKKDDGLAAFRDENARKHEAEDADLAAFRDEGAKKVEEEAGAQGKGFMRRAYDKLTQGLSALAPDPEKEAAIVQSDNATAGALARGVGNIVPFNDRMVAGEKTLLPEALGGTGKSYDENLEDARAAKAQTEKGHPIATVAGKVVGGLLGGGVAQTASKAIGSALYPMADYAAAEAPTAWNAMKSGFGFGASGGAVQGASDAPDWTKPGDTAKHIVGESAVGGVLGSAASVLTHGVSSAWEKGKDLLLRKSSPVPEEFAGDFRGKLGSDAERRAAEDAKAAAKAKKDLETSEANTAEREAGRAEEARRATERAEKGDDRSLTGLRKKALEKLEEKTQSRAIQARKTASDAAEAAEKAKTEAAATEESAKKLASEQAGGEKSSKKDTAEHLREKVDSVVKDLVAQRNEKSGLPKILKDAGGEDGKPIVRTNSLISYVEQKGAKLKSTEAKETLAWVKDKLKTDFDGGQVKGVTLHNADEIRREIGDARRSIQNAMKERHIAGAKDDLDVLKDLEAQVKQAADKAYPGYSDAIRKYAEESRALDPFTYKGAFAINKLDPLSREYKLAVGRVTDSVLNKVKAGESGLADLIKAKPELSKVIDAHLSEKLFGAKGLENDVTAAKIKDFIKQQKNVLDEADLTPKYMEMLEKRQASEATAKQAEETAKAAQAAHKEAEAAATGATKAREKVAGWAAEKAPEPAKAAKSEADKRREDHTRDLVKEREARQTAADAHTYLQEVVGDKERLPNKELAEKARKYAEKLASTGAISKEEASAWVTEANELDKAFARREDAQKAYQKYKDFIVGTSFASTAARIGGLIGGGLFLRNVPKW